MKTDVITVSSKGRQMETALKQAEKVAVYKGLVGKDALHLRLLTEEMLGMMRSITGETEGQFWIEDESGVYRLHLKVNTRMNANKQEQLLAASTSGKNEAKRGLMDRLRDFFCLGAEDSPQALPLMTLMPEMFEAASTPTLDWEWSMVRYEDALNARIRQNDAAAKEAWDELEKSVVARVADDVKVSIKGGAVEMIITKKFA